MFENQELENGFSQADWLNVFQKGSWEWLRGVSDLHVYCLPCVYHRLFDEVELAKQFRAVGYRAFV